MFYKLLRRFRHTSPSCDTKRLRGLFASRRDKHSESTYATAPELQTLDTFAEDALCEQNDLSCEAHACVVYKEEVLNRKRNERKVLENARAGSPLVIALRFKNEVSPECLDFAESLQGMALHHKRSVPRRGTRR